MAFSLITQLNRQRKVRQAFCLSLSLIFLGWVLAAYQMPLWGWGITIICLTHLTCAGRSAIPLALAWLNGVIWVGAYQFATPVGFMWRNAKYWSISLIFLWIMATVIVVTIAKTPKRHKRQTNSFMAFIFPAVLISTELVIGLLLFQIGVSLR